MDRRIEEYIADFYRPLFGLSIALDHAIWGLDPLGYQITSLLLFGAGGLVVFAVARRLLGSGATIGPLVATAAYLLHPSHIEVVPVPARRPDLLCWLFMGLALSRSGVVAAVAGLLAMMSKEAGLLIPALALVAAVLGSRRAGFLARLAEAEILHYHERTWEIYQVLEGRLKIAVKPLRQATWEVISLAVHDMVILTPGTIHLVDSTYQHVTQVIQSPPSLTDKVVIHQQDEIDAAKAAYCMFKVVGHTGHDPVELPLSGGCTSLVLGGP